jgi:hypothetical protein
LKSPKPKPKIKGCKKEVKYVENWNNNGMLGKKGMSELGNKQTQNLTTIIIAVTTNLKYSLNGGGLLWYF